MKVLIVVCMMIAMRATAEPASPPDCRKYVASFILPLGSALDNPVPDSKTCEYDLKGAVIIQKIDYGFVFTIDGEAFRMADFQQIRPYGSAILLSEVQYTSGSSLNGRKARYVSEIEGTSSNGFPVSLLVFEEVK